MFVLKINSNFIKFVFLKILVKKISQISIGLSGFFGILIVLSRQIYFIKKSGQIIEFDRIKRVIGLIVNSALDLQNIKSAASIL